MRKRPHALQRTAPDSSLLHSGVVDVWQFWQTGCVKGEVWSVREAAMMRQMELNLLGGIDYDKR